MRLSAFTDYSLRVLMYLGSDSDRFATIGEIARMHGISENHLMKVVHQLGKAGYLAFAPDGLSPLGGYPGNDEQGREMQASMDPARLMADFFAGYQFLRDHGDGTGRVGCVGFCYGGGVCNALAVAFPATPQVAGDLFGGVASGLAYA